MRWTGFVVVDKAITAAHITAVKRSAYDRMNILPQVTDRVVFVCDSRGTGLVADHQESLAMQLVSHIKAKAEVINFSNGGRTASQMLTECAPTAAALVRQLSKNVAVVLAGVNDFIVDNATVAVALARVQALCLYLKNAGFKVVLLAELVNTYTTGSANTKVPQLRTAMLAAGAAGMNATVLLDVSALPSVAGPSNTAYYVDGLHQTTSTNIEICSALAPVIDGLLSA